MKKIYYVSFLLLALAAFWTAFYLKGDFSRLYEDIAKGVAVIEKTDLGSVANQAAKQVFAPAPLSAGGKENGAAFVKAKIIAQTNAQRYDNGVLPPLAENVQLDAAAKAKAEDIFKNQYFEHVSPSGVDPGELVKKYGYDYIVSGENLILGNFADEKEIVQDWMNSPGHRANILNNRFTDIGVAIIKGTYKGRTVWVGVQEFGLPLSSCPAPSETLKNQIEANKTQLDNLSVQIDQKKSQIDAARKNSSEHDALVQEYNNLVEQYNDLANSTKIIIAQFNEQVNAFNTCVAGS